MRVFSGFLVLVLGGFFPLIGYGYVIPFGALLIAYGTLTLRFDRTPDVVHLHRRWHAAVSVGDSLFALSALLLFSSDQTWVIAPMVVPLIIVAAFRIGPRGAFGAAAVNAIGYIAGSALRSAVFGFPVDWLEIVLLIVLSFMTATLVTAILIEAETLRAARRDLYEPLLAAQSRLGELIVVSEGGYATYVSAGVTTVTGLSAEELTAIPLRQLFPELASRNGERGEHLPGGEARHFEGSLRRPDGTTAHVEVTVSDLPSLHGLKRSLIVARDITEHARARSELERLAIHDTLTGLPNRLLLCDRLERALARHSDEAQPAVLHFDLVRFRDVNDAFGRAGGDAVLVTVATRLRDAMGVAESVGRDEGDEFVVILEDGAAAESRAGELLSLLTEAVEVNGQPLQIEATVGLAISPEHGEDADALIRHAEAAMYQSKTGTASVRRYHPADDRHGAARIALLDDLQNAIARNELWLAFQPIVEMESGRPVSMEALLRWNHPTRGAIPPMEFIPLAEESGLIRQIGLWVLGEAARTCAGWPRGTTGVSVNLSLRNLRLPELTDAIASILEMWQLPFGALTVEITESIVMEDPEGMILVLRALETLGVRASVDDYGTGYSSLAYLLRLPVREMKIDRAFVADMAVNPQSEMIVRSTIDLAHDLGLLVVAEGIENEETWNALRGLGCDLAQGYFIARPMPADAVRAWLRERRQASLIPEPIPA